LESRYSLKKQTAYLFTGKFVSVLLRFLVPVIMVRIMSRQEFGLYKQALLICFFFVPILQFGITESLLYFYPNNRKNKELISQTLYLFLFIGVVFLAAFHLFHEKLLILFKGSGLKGVLQPISIFIFFYFITMFFENVLILEKRKRQLLIYVIMDRLTYVVFIILAAIIYRTVEKILWSLSIYGAGKFLFVLIYLKINYKFPVSIRKISLGQLKEQLIFSVYQGTGKIVGEIGRKIDKFYLSYFLSPVSFAIYSVGNFTLPIVDIMYNSVAATALPRISAYYKKMKYKEAKELWHKIIVYYSLITIPLVAYCWSMAEEIITILFTDKYIDSVIIFRLLLLVYLARILSRGTIVRASNNTKYAFHGNILSLLTGAVLGYFLIKSYGTAGAACSAIVAFFSNALYQVYKSKTILLLSYREWLPWKKIGIICLVSLSMLIIVPGLKKIITSDLFTILASGSIYSLLILVGYHFAGFVDISKVTYIIRRGFAYNKQI
jgi:O-antigen/teichoic acid export membrane protein